jgi:hypothetical protein
VCDEQIALLAAVGLAGVEVAHPDPRNPNEPPRFTITRDPGLVGTGSGDDQGSLTGRRIGCETAPAGAYEVLLVQPIGTQPVWRG